ncbi:MAG: ABC transporter substrate-binding protein [Clostridiales bacterium]|nr:ABC transporter substrate-binding protein [Clostridiales bacterium]
MKRASKVLSLTLAAALAVSMAACGGSSSATDKNKTEAGASAGNAQAAGDSDSTAGTTYHIGVLQQLEHPALDSATEGFKDALTELLGTDNVVFDVQNAQGEQANCATIANNFVANGYDLILANATTALQSAAAATSSIPILGTSVTDYATALDIDDWSGATGTNISGTSDLAPLDQQEDMLIELFPDAKTVGILYCSAEPNSIYQATQFAAALEADGLAYKEYTVADSNDIASVVQNAIAEVDVIYIPTDNTMAGNTETIHNIALPAGVPIIAGEAGICSGCGVATLSISYYDIGYRAGEMAYDVLVNGADITTMEIQYADSVTKQYNAEICTKLGITIPDDYEAIATE